MGGLNDEVQQLWRSAAESVAERQRHQRIDKEALAEVASSVRCLQRELTEIKKDVQEQQLTDLKQNVQAQLQHGLTELQKEVQVSQQLMAQEHRSLARTVAKDRELLQALQVRLERALCERSVDDWAREAAAKIEVAAEDMGPAEVAAGTAPATPAKSSVKSLVELRSFAGAGVEDMPHAWRTFLEDVVRQAQWVCEETLRESLHQREDHLREPLNQFRAAKAEQEQRFAKATEEMREVNAQALERSEEALAAARLSAELVKESEEAASRQVAKAESDLRAELKAVTRSLGDWKEDSALAQRLQGATLEEARLAMERGLSDALGRAGRLDEVAKMLEGTICEVAKGTQRNALDLEDIKARVQMVADALGLLRDDVESRLKGLQHQADKLRADMATQGSSFVEAGHATEAASSKKAEELKAHFAELAAEVGVLQDRQEKQASDASSRLSRFREDLEVQGSVALEARSMVSQKCGELESRLFQEVRAAVADEARASMAEKCRELSSFAERLRDVALEEVRSCISASGVATTETAESSSRCGGSGVGAARALRQTCPPA